MGRIAVTFLLILACTGGVSADDVGLITARLIEGEKHEYAIETDVSPQMVGILGAPVLPPGFRSHKSTEYRRQGALINVRYQFRGDRALSREDVLLFPWLRTGVFVDAIWLDGTRNTALFLARVHGIPISIGVLKPRRTAGVDVFKRHSLDGISRAASGWGAWLLVVALLTAASPKRAVWLVFLIATGHAFSLVIADLRGPRLPFDVDGWMLVAALVVAWHVARDDGRSESPARRLQKTRFAPVAMTIGILGGLAHGSTSAASESAAGHGPLALTGYVVGTGTFLIAAVGCLALCVAAARRMSVSVRALGLSVGIAATAGIFHTVVASLPPPASSGQVTAGEFQLMPRLSKGGIPQSASASRAPRQLTRPIMIFLTAEPVEVRCEVLAAGESLVSLLGFPLREKTSLELDEQAALKDRALERIQERLSISLDGRVAAPNFARADFLTLGPAGAATRTQAAPEPLETAVVGLTLAYAVPSLPEEISLGWRDLPEEVLPVPVALTDPGGVRGGELSASSPTMRWETDPTAFEPPEVSAVEVSRPTWALVSALLMGVVTAVWVAGFRLAPGRLVPVTVCVSTVLAIGLFPLARIPAPWRTVMREDAAASTLEQLLTNVYRSFAYRDESTIYDRLSVSVTGEQLAAVYLQQRRALELENRGGARARVDQVRVTGVESVRAESDRRTAVTATWAVSGSVSHFGHTHYRRNQYTAVVYIVPRGGVWKIDKIEVREERRVL